MGHRASTVTPSQPVLSFAFDFTPRPPDLFASSTTVRRQVCLGRLKGLKGYAY
ncbi:hypothetical protein JYU34_008137 [Plutella xylostella]|uniref:Uncharacterized protein n=1 Tax=Plutella xylostella TaxID=51655 RepID=A0ABQ7QNU7_PLUXY|nr:hypothetical protein JYU34_008137 [Plutella xylostella]